MRKLILRKEDRTHWIIWLLAIVCTILTVAVTITGLAVIIVYLIYEPRMPFLVVTGAHLDKLDYDQSGLLDTALTIDISAENDNARAHATFADLNVKLRFRDVAIAELRADPFDVGKNRSVALNYVVASVAVPLDEGGMEEVDASLRRDLIRFGLDGQTRVSWMVGFALKVKLWSHLSCEIPFFVSNGSTNGLDCSSKSHSL